MPEYLLVANWKMNGLASHIVEAEAISKSASNPNCDVVICPPAALLSRMKARLSHSSLRLGGQDCHASASGAHTGDHSAEMLADAGGEFVILGHSERRSDHHETSDEVKNKTQAAWHASLTAIVCVGETEAARLKGQEFEVVGEQLSASVPQDVKLTNKNQLVIAYEPVWAIGTGRTASEVEIADMHKFISRFCTQNIAHGDNIPILYGGSVNGANAHSIFSVPYVNGALVGGASLTAESFIPIIDAVP